LPSGLNETNFQKYVKYQKEDKEKRRMGIRYGSFGYLPI
jgi:hypothetical protein